MRRAGGDRQSAPELLAGVAVVLWQYRLELGSVAVAVAGQRLLSGRMGDVTAAIVVTALLAVFVVIAPVRRVAWRAVRRSWVRRAWERASTDAGLGEGPLYAPLLLAVERIPAGDLIRVRVRGGQSVTALDARSGGAGRLAAGARGPGTA
jgi:hypothetical protein